VQLALPENEVDRLENLRSYAILDTPLERVFDDLTRLAAFICGTPIALMGFMDVDRLWFKSRIGWDVPEVPRDMTFCAYTILESDVLIVSDTLEDKGRLATCPLATHGGVRFYAGVPLISPEGYALGALCAMDSVPRGLTEGQIDALRKLARQAMQLVESRRPVTDVFATPQAGDVNGRDEPGLQSEDRFRTIVENASDAVIEIDEASNILYVNRAAEQIFGYERKEILGQPLTILMPEHLRQDHRRALARYLESGEKHLSWRTVEFPGLDKGGREIWLEVSLSEYGVAGKRVFAGACRDISQRKLIEQERARFAAIVASSADAIMTTDLAANITSWNQGAERVYGYGAAEVVGKQSTLLAPPELSQEMGDILNQLKAARSIEDYETVRVRKDGRSVHVSLSVSPIYDESGKLLEAAVIARDLTQRKPAEEALRQSEQRLQGIINSAMDAIITVDAHHRIVVFNRSAEQIFGCPATSALGQTMESFIPEKFREKFQEYIKEFAVTEAPGRSFESPDALAGLRRDGEEFPVEATISQMDADGEKFFTLILRDIGSRLRMEAELRQAQKMEAVGQLAGGVAHEFNNFLGVILGYSELLAEGARENERLSRYVSEIRTATQHAASLTRQLLAFGRKQVVEPRVLDLNQAIWEGHKLLRRLVPANIDVVPVLAPKLGRVKLDMGQIQQILINLVVNARDAMPQGGRVIIETGDVELDEAFTSRHIGVAPGSYVMLSVSDTGSGIAPEVRSHIFEPFYTTKQQGKGTGLGLSTIYGIVKQSGGLITVESAPGQGTTFRIYLPRILEPTEAVKPMRPHQREQPGSTTILIVEDDGALRRLLTVTLERRNYRVLAAKDGAEGLEIFRQHAADIHLIATDMIMPRLDGLRLRERIVAIRSDVKFLFMSGYSEEIAKQSQRSLAGCGFLEKPFLPDELEEKVRELLSGDAAA
jgi:two-component system, cell cycle sensor histidine kinase and response regulator CckA